MKLIQILKEIISEIKIVKKEPIAVGTQHSIYSNNRDASKVFKAVNPDYGTVSTQAYNWVKIFKEHPDLFPKVYRSNDKGAEVEKLNAKKAEDDYKKISIALFEEFGSGSFQELLYSILENDNDNWKPKVKEYKLYLDKKDKSLSKIFDKFVKLMIALQVVNEPEFTIDAHHGNFGYDSSGNLKMTDI
jgi:hypothetical protein